MLSLGEDDCYIRTYVIILVEIFPLTSPATKILVGMCPRHPRRRWRQCLLALVISLEVYAFFCTTNCSLAMLANGSRLWFRDTLVFGSDLAVNPVVLCLTSATSCWNSWNTSSVRWCVLRIKPCPHWRLSPNSATVAVSPKTATVAEFGDKLSPNLATSRQCGQGLVLFRGATLITIKSA